MGEASTENDLGILSDIVAKINKYNPFGDADWGEALMEVIILLAMIQLATLVHETGHNVSASLLGYDFDSTYANMFAGGTFVDDVEDISHIKIIALSGPLLSFLFGIYLWELEKDLFVGRIGGMVAWFYSTLPNLYPLLGGTDMYLAVVNGGLPLGLGVIIFVLVSTYVARKVGKEIKDKGEI